MFSVFTTILLAFAFSFHLAMRKHHVFDNAFTSFLKMINMMVGEYNFDENFTFEKGTKRNSIYYSQKNCKGLISDFQKITFPKS
jgi:hypothetical protein